MIYLVGSHDNELCRLNAIMFTLDSELADRRQFVTADTQDDCWYSRFTAISHPRVATRSSRL